MIKKRSIYILVIFAHSGEWVTDGNSVDFEINNVQIKPSSFPYRSSLGLKISFSIPFNGIYPSIHLLSLLCHQVHHILNALTKCCNRTGNFTTTQHGHILACFVIQNLCTKCSLGSFIRRTRTITYISSPPPQSHYPTLL